MINKYLKISNIGCRCEIKLVYNESYKIEQLFIDDLRKFTFILFDKHNKVTNLFFASKLEKNISYISEIFFSFSIVAIF